jgi:hypothetical protein
VTTLSFVICCSILLTVCLGALVLLWRQQVSQSRTLTELFTTHQATLSSSLSLLEKAQALVAASDPLAYQAIQAMSSPQQYSEPDFDPSEEGEIARIAARSGVTTVGDAYDDDALADVALGALRDLS